jgi:eukaryotic-like serine/threonine-protein kinase
MNWTTGKKLSQDKYTIQRVLGEGGFGITYLAINNHNDDKVAIKTLNITMQKHRDFDIFQNYLLDEAKLLDKCKHRHIVKFYEVFKENNLWCLVMEYVEGESLDKTIKNQVVLPEDIAIKYIKQIGNALTTIHYQGILHRDVKPENIIKRQNCDEVVLIDFGIAREFNINQTGTHTQFVSDGFAPLEQYYSKRKRGNYTDVYALAATLYVMLTGYDRRGRHYLPRSMDREDQINNQKSDLLKPAKSKNSNISHQIDQAILWGMKLDYKQRPQFVDEWLESFDNSNYSSVHQKTIPVNLSHVYKKTYTNFNKLFLNDEWIGKGIIGALIMIILMYIFRPCFSDICRIQPEPKPINYQLLQKLLQDKKFKEADQETLNIMLLLAHKHKNDWLNQETIKNIPCQDFIKINQLWIRYSQGKFGFSTQRKIWINLGGEAGIFDEKLAQPFNNTVAWDIKNMTYDLSAPKGHLPFLTTSRIYKFGAPYITEKVEDCGINNQKK